MQVQMAKARESFEEKLTRATEIAGFIDMAITRLHKQLEALSDNSCNLEAFKEEAADFIAAREDLLESGRNLETWGREVRNQWSEVNQRVIGAAEPNSFDREQQRIIQCVGEFESSTGDCYSQTQTHLEKLNRLVKSGVQLIQRSQQEAGKKKLEAGVTLFTGIIKTACSLVPIVGELVFAISAGKANIRTIFLGISSAYDALQRHAMKPFYKAVNLYGLSQEFRQLGCDLTDCEREISAMTGKLSGLSSDLKCGAEYAESAKMILLSAKDPGPDDSAEGRAAQVLELMQRLYSLNEDTTARLSKQQLEANDSTVQNETGGTETCEKRSQCTIQ